MPASHERVPNRPLSGSELREIIEKDVHSILMRDGMFTQNIAFGRVSYEVRVSMHLDNPVYPEHVSTTLSRPSSKQQIEQDASLAAIEDGNTQLVDPSDDAAIFSEERHREIQSPNMARVENGMGIPIDKKNLDTGTVETIKQVFKGDIPDPESVGNITKDSHTSGDQSSKWKKGDKK